MRYPLLSFLELQRLSKQLESAIVGAQIDRIFIPECTEHPQGFFKNEIVLEFRHSQLLISLRSQACGLAFLPRKGMRPAKNATRSAFDLSLAKEVEGLRITSVAAIPGDRMLQLSFSGDHHLSLFLNFIPAVPEGTLVSTANEISVLASSKARDEFSIPLARSLSAEEFSKIPNRAEYADSLPHYSDEMLKARTDEALTLRKQRLLNHIEKQLRSVDKKIKSLEQQAEQSSQEPDWKYFGSLLQTHLHSKPVLKNRHYTLMDYEKGVEVQVPGDSKLNLKQQLEKYFHQAKRNKIRIEESQRRIADLSEKKISIEKNLPALRAPDVKMETLLKIEAAFLGTGPTTDRATTKKIAGYSGKLYQSQEGLTILSGRSKEENLELTFKVARGNDLWLHVKGRPGSHTIILLPPNKTASLETLLDAANLCLLHSGGKDWGKTEVDYTQRKNVKKIKNQSEVSYSGNKTLVVNFDQERIQRLYGEN